MIESQVMIILDVMLAHRNGLTLDGISDAIYEGYGDMFAARMMIGESNRHMLRSRLREFKGITEDDIGVYRLDLSVRPYAMHNLVNHAITCLLDERTKVR